MRFFPWLLVLMAALGFGTVAGSERLKHQEPQANQETATVRIQLVSSYGTELESDATVDVFQGKSGGRNLAARFKHNMARAMPYGVYRLRVRVSGFWTAERELRVFRPNVLAVVALDMGRVDGGWPPSKVIGKVKNAEPSASLVHVRLSGLYSSTVMDAELSPDGSFEFSGVPDGTYILLTTREGDLPATHEGTVLDCRQASVPVSAPVVIELSSRQGKP
jgi:hypothetical protein